MYFMAQLQAKNTPHGHLAGVRSSEYDDAALLVCYLHLLIGFPQFLFLNFLVFSMIGTLHQLRSHLLVKFIKIHLVFLVSHIKYIHEQTFLVS